MDTKERENFNRCSTLIEEHTKEGLTNLIELNVTHGGYGSFETFINAKQHEIYHLCYNRTRCCQCPPGYTLPSARVLHPSQLELLLHKNGPKKMCHKPGRTGDLCCCFSHRGLTTNILDVTLARCLLVNFCQDVFWYSCLTAQKQTLEDFLTHNKHHIYHLCVINSRCCKCPSSYVFPTQRQIITKTQWNLLFNTPCLPCQLDRKQPAGRPQTICGASVTPGITVGHLGVDMSQLLIDHCCTLKKSVEKLVQLRNNVFGHVKEARITDNDYAKYRNLIESNLLLIARICNKESEVQQNVRNLDRRTLDGTLLMQSIKDQLYTKEVMTEEMAQVEFSIKEHIDKKMKDMSTWLNSQIAQDTVKQQIEDIHNLGLETTEDFTEIMQKGSYKCYWNRVYLVGNYNVGKTTLAKILVGDLVPEVRTSTDGIWLYIGLAGMDIEERKWVYLPKGNAMRTVLTTMLMSIKRQKAEEDVSSERNKDLKGNSAQTTMMQEESITSLKQEVDLLEQREIGDQFQASSTSILYERNPSEGTSSLESALDANLVGNVLETMSNEKLRELVVEAAKEGKYKMKIVPIDIWDFGGQKDYYMTHQLFINSRGIFVLMFNGSHDIHKHMPDLAFLPGHHGKPTIAVYLKHWVNSILTYCRRTKDCFPRVLFVATHRDMIPEATLKVHREKLVKSIDDLFRDHAKRGHLEYNSLLFINATDASDPEIDMLRQKLIERVFEHPSWGEEMPTAWIPLELELAQEVENGNSIISKEQIEALNDRNESFKLNDKQLVSFLKIQHALGKLIYFDDIDLRNFIVINPVYMIEILRSIVTDRQFWPRGEHFIDAHRSLRQHGIIDKSTIFSIWEQEEFRHILPHKDYVLNILVHLDIIVAPRTGLESLHKPISDIRFFLVPCMITNPDQTDYMIKACTQASSIILAYTFVDDVIPPALSYRFLGSCLTSWDLKVYKGHRMIFSDLAVVEVGKSHDVAVQMKEKRVVVYLVHACNKNNIVPTLASSVQECLTAAIHRISEFYSSLAEEGTGFNSTDVMKPFEIEYGVFCPSSICFFHPSKLPSTLKAPLQCKQHQISHNILEMHHWYAEKNPADRCPETCKGLGLLEMEQRPSDRHIRRLISELSPDTCRQLAIFLGLKHNQWENLQSEFQHDNVDNVKFMAVWKWKQRDRKACFNHLKAALEKCSCNDHCLCQAFRDIDIDTDLSEETLDSVPSIQSLTAVSDYIGNSSLQLGIELGLEVPELENIQIQLRNKPLEQTREILLRWRKYDHVDHKLRTLVKALERIGKSSCLNDINF